MSTAAKKLSIRLAAVGGDKVRREFKSLGADGDRAFRQITQVITPANDNLKALDATARSFNEFIRQGTALFGAYLGFQGLKNTFSAIFSANTSFEQLSGSLKTVTGSAKGAQEAFALIEKFAINTPYQLNEIVNADSVETREEILKLILHNPKITTKDIAKELKISPKGIEWHLSRMKKLGQIRHVGSTKSGYWEVMCELLPYGIAGMKNGLDENK